MIVLLIGVPDSGKSHKAEEIATELAAGGPLYYIATMVPYGEEGRKRVAKHRKMRKGKGFTTVECPLEITSLVHILPDLPCAVCLLECLSNLVGNEMHRDGADAKNLADRITTEVLTLAQNARHTVIVSNDFPADDPQYDADTKDYVSLLSAVNRRLANHADRLLIFTEGEWKNREDT